MCCDSLALDTSPYYTGSFPADSNTNEMAVSKAGAT
jgi:hypothetical protein